MSVLLKTNTILKEGYMLHCHGDRTITLIQLLQLVFPVTLEKPCLINFQGTQNIFFSIFSFENQFIPNTHYYVAIELHFCLKYAKINL